MDGQSLGLPLTALISLLQIWLAMIGLWLCINKVISH